MATRRDYPHGRRRRRRFPFIRKKSIRTYYYYYVRKQTMYSADDAIVTANPCRVVRACGDTVL